MLLVQFHNIFISNKISVWSWRDVPHEHDFFITFPFGCFVCLQHDLNVSLSFRCRRSRPTW